MDIINTAIYNLRPAQIEDEGTLLQIYASTRMEEMALVPWTDEGKETFIRMQFDAQTKHYLTYYPSATYHVVLHQLKSVGRLILNSTDRSILIIDIALLPDYCNQGIGTAILQDIMDQARRSNLPVVLRVEFFNPAIRLYSRLGFLKTREVNSVYHEMIWTPDQN